ncbi:MAG TPA: DUF3175 domain-containing protein [Chthoniobacterales bacterium]|jgi:hypothetical protein
MKKKTAKHDRKNARRKTSAKKETSSHRWSSKVTQESDALDLEPHIFESRSPRKIALSLKRSAEKSRRRKSTPRQSATSMLSFYINRAGKNLSPGRLAILKKAKAELKAAFEEDAKEK